MCDAYVNDWMIYPTGGRFYIGRQSWQLNTDKIFTICECLSLIAANFWLKKVNNMSNDVTESMKYTVDK